MIEKIIPGDSQEELIKQAGTLVQVYESSRHIKQAASNMFSRADLEKHAPPQGKFLSHMITMGSQEMYGANRNCWFAGTPVRTPSGFKPIEELVEGDLVLTTKGRYRPITKTFTRDYEGTAVRVKAQGLALPFVCTAEHPIERLALEHVRPEKLYKREGKKGSHKRPGPAKAQMHFSDAALEHVEFVEAHKLRPGDWVCVPLSETGGEEEFYAADAWVYGLFLADGCAYKEYRDIASQGDDKGIVFTLGEGDDAGVIPRLLEVIESHGNKASVLSSYTSAKGRRIQWCNQQFARSCSALFGRGAHNKTLSAAVFAQSDEWKLRMLAGWFDGDGCLIKDGEEKYRGTLVCSSVSHDLVSAAQRLLASAGIPSSVSRGSNKSSNGCFGSGYLPIYSISVGPAYSNLILQHSARMQLHDREVESSRTQRIAAGRLWFRISKVELTEEIAPCFNIEVEEDHTYVTTVSGHNCDDWPHEELMKKHASFVTHGRNYREHRNNDPKLAIGEIKAAAYDPVKQRGEILMWTDIDKAASEFEKARAGEEQHGSMAASVDHDVCECCGFKSKTASDRCDHIRYTPGAYLKEFRKYAHMINIDPTFKDYSWVSRPADRIAHTLNYLMPLSKAASAQTHLRGDQLAEIYGVVSSPWLPYLQKIAEFDVVDHENPAKRAAAFSVLPRAFEGQFADTLLTKMSGHAYPGKVMRSLYDRSMVMPLASFNSYLTGKCVHDSLADPVVKEAGEKMATVRAILIQRISAEPELSRAFSEACGQFEPMSCGCEDVVDQFMDQAKDQFSLRYEALAKRACHNPMHLKKASNSEDLSSEAFGLATLYNAYLAKTASHLDDDWMNTAQMAYIH
jgi:hypothetical protein